MLFKHCKGRKSTPVLTLGFRLAVLETDPLILALLLFPVLLRLAKLVQRPLGRLAGRVMPVPLALPDRPVVTLANRGRLLIRLPLVNHAPVVNRQFFQMIIRVCQHLLQITKVVVVT